MKVKKIAYYFSFFVLYVISCDAYSQIAVTSYSNLGIGVNTSAEKRISGELKIFANQDINDVIFEIDAFYNFKSREYHRFSMGVGIGTASRTFHGIGVPIVLEVYPIQNFKKLSLLIEVGPEVLKDYVNVRSLFGIRYSFGKLKN